MMLYELTIRVNFKCDGKSDALEGAENILDHLMRTFNDDDSLTPVGVEVQAVH